ncbi:MAG: hypothetical protein KatS3mg126_1628 [Lysobacteraceae bacterium]|nr:MAG: hypothetical protein KatS3mg126_1628 [Xanthomonadaceae bacterium]
MAAAPLIEIRGLVKTYQRGKETIEVLHGIDLDIPEGDFVALMGPSGSGKTTLLNLIGGLDTLTAGSLRIGGRNIEELDADRLAAWRAETVGFVFQSYNLMPVLSAQKNVELPLLLTDFGARERARRARIALRLVGLEDRARHKPGELSGGQQQRVAIARALVSDPRILICDEPTGDLDRRTADEILTLLQQLNREFGKTLVMVTHDPKAAEYARRIVHLDKGTLVGGRRWAGPIRQRGRAVAPMKYLHLIASALLRRKLRTLFTLASLTAAFLLLGLLQAVNTLFASGADFLGASRIVVQARTSFTQPLPMRLLPRIESVPGVVAVSHSQFFGGQYQDERAGFPQFVVNPQRLRLTYPEWIMPEDQWRAFVSTQDGAIVGRHLADRYGWKIGDIVPLNSFIWTRADGSRTWEWRIVGIFDGKDREWQDRTRLMYLNYAQFDEGRSPAARGLAGVFVAKVDDPLRTAEIAAAIDARFDNSPDETKSQSEQEFQLGFIRQLGDIGFIMNAISGAVFFTILILTGFTMSQGVRERVPELAVLKCLGFTDLSVLGLVLGEAMLLCGIGALCGMLLASAVVAGLPPEFPPLRTDLRVWAFAGISVLVLALAVGLPPALRAKRLKIVDALAGR